jgi:hypothetical protein
VLVFVNDAAEAITSAYGEVRDLAWIGNWFRQPMEWSGVGDSPVWPVGVVVPFVFAQGVHQVALVPDERAVEQFVAGSFESTAP